MNGSTGIMDASSRRREWPTAPEYIAAVQLARDRFVDPDLREAIFATDDTGLPTAATGQSAIVFYATVGGEEVAVRCFTNPVYHGAQRYAALAALQRREPLAAFASAQWQEDGVKVRGELWPVVRMERLLGQSMITYVHDHQFDAGILRRLAESWREMVNDLQRRNVAHGDLQPHNVRITQGRPRLLDLDAVWLPEISTLVPGELGHPDFQHPARRHASAWNGHVDVFPALVVYLSLYAIAADHSLFGEFNNEVNLLFTEPDFVDPGREVWRRLQTSRDTTVRELVDVLGRLCRDLSRDPTAHPPSLEAALDMTSRPAPPAPEPVVAPVPWWPEPAAAPERAPSGPTAVHPPAPDVHPPPPDDGRPARRGLSTPNPTPVPSAPPFAIPPPAPSPSSPPKQPAKQPPMDPSPTGPGRRAVTVAHLGLILVVTGVAWAYQRSIGRRPGRWLAAMLVAVSLAAGWWLVRRG
jgi:hypothetical protein